MTAPIALFVYNRPEHTRKTVDALAKNELATESSLFVFADGPKTDADALILTRIKETREIVHRIKGFKNVTVFESEENKGLAASIVSGVSKIVAEFGNIVVLEDDLVTSPFFLRYMNDALSVYEHQPSVACISGYVYPLKKKFEGTFFLKGADCWGWATWKRAWDVYQSDGQKLLSEINGKHLENEFGFNNTYPYLEMLKDQIEGRNDSWAIRWYASAFLKNMYCLYPGVSLVQNVGTDGSGTHSGVTELMKVNLTKERLTVNGIPVRENTEARTLFEEYFKSLKKVGFKERLRKYLTTKLHLSIGT